MALDPVSQGIIDRQNAAAAYAKSRQNPGYYGHQAASEGLISTAPRYPSASGAGATPAPAREGISEKELSRIRSVVGADKQPTVSRGNIAGEQAARDAAFARAKEQSAQVARSSLTGLRNALSRRGITGGGYADMRTAEALAPAADQLQDFTREQLIQDLGKSERGADLEYQGQIAQRGQNQASVNALLSMINSRGGLLY